MKSVGTFALPILVTIVALFVLPAAAYAFELMQIEQVIGGVGGDTSVQAIQLRMRADGQNLVSGGRLAVFDAAGQNPVTILDLASDVSNGMLGDRVLICSANFPSHTKPVAVPDFTMTNLIPASYLAAGSLVWEGDDGTVYWRLSWGGSAYTGSNAGSTLNDDDGNFGPPYRNPLPASEVVALLFLGLPGAKSVSNDANYPATTGPVFFVNNGGAPFKIKGSPPPQVILTATDTKAAENPSTNTGKFILGRSFSGAEFTQLKVKYTLSGTATNGQDYQQLSGTVTFPIGASGSGIIVRPIDDSIPEPDETVTVTLTPSSNYTILNGTGTVTIQSDE